MSKMRDIYLVLLASYKHKSYILNNKTYFIHKEKESIQERERK